MIAALYVEAGGCYDGQPDIEAWTINDDARRYRGPHPVVAHPPCQRWGRYHHGSTRKPHQFKLGDDGGCFAAALRALADFGGVIEHPCDSKAWRWYGLRAPLRHAGWQRTPGPLIWWRDGDVIRAHNHRHELGWWTCYVEQGHYGHMSRKPTWLLTRGVTLPQLDWSKGEQRLHPVALARYGYAKARRIGMTAMVGGKDKTRIRNATPPEFRDVLVGIARTVRQST